MKRGELEPRYVGVDGLYVKKAFSKGGKPKYLTRPRMPCAYGNFMKDYLRKYNKYHNKKKTTLALSVQVTAAAWKKMSAGVQQAYVKEAEARMPLYEKDMQAYQHKLDLSLLHKALSPFSVFWEERYHKREINAGVSAIVSLQKLSDKWESMSDAEKAPYISDAKKNLADYEKNVVARCQEESSDASSDESEKANPEDVADAATAFLLFLEDSMFSLEESPKKLSADEYVEHLSKRWNSMSSHTKDSYFLRAESMMELYEKKALEFFLREPATESDEPATESEEPETESVESATTPYLLFMEDFEVEYKDNYKKDPRENLPEFLSDLSAAWDVMTDYDKASYLEDANEAMLGFEKSAIAFYKKMLVDMAQEKPEVSEETVPAATGLLAFLKERLENNPENNSVSDLEGLWSSMSDGEKAPYNTDAEDCMVQYEKSMKDYYKSLAEYDTELEAYNRKVDKEAIADCQRRNRSFV